MKKFWIERSSENEILRRHQFITLENHTFHKKTILGRGTEQQALRQSYLNESTVYARNCN